VTAVKDTAGAAEFAARRASVSQWLAPLARDIFDRLYRQTQGTQGVTRASWGDGETAAVDILTAQAHALGLATSVDAIGNLYIDLPGRDRSAPRWASGSHLDSVPAGGNSTARRARSLRCWRLRSSNARASCLRAVFGRSAFAARRRAAGSVERTTAISVAVPRSACCLTASSIPRCTGNPV
jgi:hypothetical protein